MLEAVKALEDNEELREKYSYLHVMEDEPRMGIEFSINYCSYWHKNTVTVDCRGFESVLLRLAWGCTWTVSRRSWNFSYDQETFSRYELQVNSLYSELYKEDCPNRDELLDRFNTPNEEGTEPEIRVYSTPEREAEEIAKIVAEDPEHSAVLARTNLALRPIEEALIENGTKYHLLGKSGFWTAKKWKT